MTKEGFTPSVERKPSTLSHCTSSVIWCSHPLSVDDRDRNPIANANKSLNDMTCLTYECSDASGLYATLEQQEYPIDTGVCVAGRSDFDASTAEMDEDHRSVGADVNRAGLDNRAPDQIGSPA
ncbi:hypothetical protein MLPF_3363 [Mycobacterium lepromatosis]|nr:hypothetical protein MLPF_3363 [Mycobacterium lepromatosis]